MTSCNICHTSWRNENIKMFRVPLNPQKRKQWSEACGRTFKDNKFICEIHFLKSDIVLRDKRRRLKPDALPVLSLHPALNSKPGEEENENLLFDKETKSWDSGGGVGSQKNCDDIKMDTDSTPADTALFKNKKQEVLKPTTFQFINEALFDETTNVNASSHNVVAEISTFSRQRCTKGVQTGSAGLRTCGFIEVDVNTQIYNMRCFHCAAVIPIYSGTQFVTHIKENHQNLEEAYLLNEDLYSETNNERSATDDNTNEIDNISVALENTEVIKKEEIEKETKAEIYSTEFRSLFYEKQETQTPESEQSRSCTEDDNIEVRDKAESKAKREQFLCEICKHHFMDEMHLRLHQYKRHQIGELPYKCRVCEHRFKSPELLQRHENYHNREKKYACSECGKRFYREKHYKEHMKVHQICEECGKKSVSRAMYIMHKKTHEPPKHICTMCSKGYFQRNRLLEHMKVHRNERDYVCEECGKAFIRQRALVAHKQSMHSNVRAYVCCICDRSYKTANALCAHRKAHHLVLEGTIEQLKPKYSYIYNKHTYIIDPVTKRKRLVCDICEKTYLKYCNLSDHKIKAHGWIPLKERPEYKLATE